MQSHEDIPKLLMQIMHMQMVYNYKQMGRPPIHPAQMRLIGWIGEHEGTTQADIAQQLNVKPSTTAISVRRLEKSGLIERRKDEIDQRVWRIFLSGQAKELREKISCTLQETKLAMLRGFDEQEITELYGYLRRITQNLTVNTQESVECEED